MLGGGGAGLIAGFTRECDSVAKALRSGAGTGQDTKGSSSSLTAAPQPRVPSSLIFVPKAVLAFITSPLGMSPQPCLRALTHNDTHPGTGTLTLHLTTNIYPRCTHTRTYTRGWPEDRISESVLTSPDPFPSLSPLPPPPINHLVLSSLQPHSPALVREQGRSDGSRSGKPTPGQGPHLLRTQVLASSGGDRFRGLIPLVPSQAFAQCPGLWS